MSDITIGDPPSVSEPNQVPEMTSGYIHVEDPNGPGILTGEITTAKYEEGQPVNPFPQHQPDAETLARLQAAIAAGAIGQGPFDDSRLRSLFNKKPPKAPNEKLQAAAFDKRVRRRERNLKQEQSRVTGGESK